MDRGINDDPSDRMPRYIRVFYARFACKFNVNKDARGSDNEEYDLETDNSECMSLRKFRNSYHRVLEGNKHVRKN